MCEPTHAGSGELPETVSTRASFDGEQLGLRVQPLAISDARARDEVRSVVTDLAAKSGFLVGALAVRRDDDHVQVAVMVGTDVVEDDFVRMVVPPEVWMRMFDGGEVYGGWHLRRWRAAEDGDPSFLWEADIPVSDDPGVWHPRDALNYPVRDACGEIVAVLGLDVPANGRVPDKEAWDRLSDLTTFAAHAIAAVLQRERQAERARFAEAAQSLLRRASLDINPISALDQARRNIEIGLSVDDVVCQLFTDPEPDGLAMLVMAGERALLADWRDDAPAREIATAESESITAVIPSESQAQQAVEVLERQNVHRALLVPVGAGSECYGGLVVARSVRRAPWTEVEARAVADLGRDLGRSIAAYRAQQRERELVSDLQRVANYKTRLVATVTHDLVSPISAIRLHLDLLEQTDGDPSLLPQALRVMKRASGELLDSVESLLALYRADRAPVARERLDLRSLVREVVAVHRPIARKRGLDLVDASTAQDRLYVDANRSEINRVFANLVGNAIKYTPSGSVTLSAERHGPCVVVRCRDTGIGMSAADQGRIFDEFFRSDDPRLAEIPGSGLGMSIVARIVESHGGTVKLTSTLGKGTCVEVSLPLA